MIAVEKDGVRMSVRSEIQASAFISSGWNRVEVAKKQLHQLNLEQLDRVRNRWSIDG